jgi:Bacterial extracellular solute-binding protein, family 7
MTRSALLGAATAAIAALLAGCSLSDSDRVGGEREAATRVLTLLDPFSNGQEAAAFGDEVARLSHGALRVRVVDGRYEGPDYEAAAIRDMRDGRADLAIAGSRAWDEFGASRLRALGAPLLIDSYRLQERVLESELVAPMLEELRPLGLVGIGILPGPIRRPLGVAHRLAGPSDFSGLTIGTQQSRVADATMRVLGAISRRLPAAVPDLAGLDGLERQVGSIESDRLDLAPDDQRQPLAAPSRRVRQWAVVPQVDKRSAPDSPHGCRERRAEEGGGRADSRGGGHRQHLPQGAYDTRLRDLR